MQGTEIRRKSWGRDGLEENHCKEDRQEGSGKES